MLSLIGDIIKGISLGIWKIGKFITSRVKKYIIAIHFVWKLRKMAKLVQNKSIMRAEAHNRYNNEIN